MGGKPFQPISDVINTSSSKHKPQSYNEIYGEPENFLEIEVRNPRTINSGKELFTDYEIVCRVIRRRYSDFVKLRKILEHETQRVIIPPLPGKILLNRNKFDDINIEKRRQGLEKFISTVSGHPLLQTGSETLINFIQDDKWYAKTF